MLSPEEINLKIERILLQVQKPGRYVGGEFNQVVKDWNKVNSHIALVFPDIYDIGLSNLGLAILYEEINNRHDALAERAYLPWHDMETGMRKAGIPLYSLESKHPLAAFDIIGISLPYETLYTNTLNLLDLSEIPIFTSERNEDHPLIIAGGHAVFNPEPMAEFIDAFVIGDGEGVFDEIIRIHQEWKIQGGSRSDLLDALSRIWGVYVPSLYQPNYNLDGTISNIERLKADAPLPIIKRIAVTLPPPPTRFLVPSVDIVHNRVSVEIMRGCTRGCRFCHAGMINRPVRERPPHQIAEAIQQALDNTGYEEVALLSLSSSDYSRILELVQMVSDRFDGQQLTISLPSLRIESFSIDLIEQLKGPHQGGFTLAPEAATDRMRNIINKPIPEDQLLETAQAIYSRGWTTLKLYFMIGHPSETMEDVHAIASLCKSIITIGQRVMGRRATLHAGISTFVPKPHTPFQWAVCDDPELIEAKQALLKRELRGPGLKMSWTDSRETMLEAWLSRGDRRLGEVIYKAWKQGAKFDAWQDEANFIAWQTAFRETGLDPAFFTHRQRSFDEVFPWDHISPGVKKSYLLTEYQASLEGKVQADCRNHCYVCGILPVFTNFRRETADADWKCPPVGESARISHPEIRS